MINHVKLKTWEQIHRIILDGLSLTKKLRYILAEECKLFDKYGVNNIKEKEQIVDMITQLTELYKQINYEKLNQYAYLEITDIQEKVKHQLILQLKNERSLLVDTMTEYNIKLNAALNAINVFITTQQHIVCSIVKNELGYNSIGTTVNLKQLTKHMPPIIINDMV